MFGFFKKKKPVPEGPKERRLIPRWKISFKCKIKWEGLADYIECFVKDLNFKGCSLSISETLPNSVKAITLYFNEMYFFNADIAIIWEKTANGNKQYGINFIKLRDSDKEKLLQMMRQNFPDCFKI